MKIAIGCDHAALSCKQAVVAHLESKGLVVEDFGTYTEESCDYPLIANNVSRGVTTGEFERGVLLCGTGIGMSIAANKVKGVRAALCHDVYSAEMTRKHNDSNVLCLGARVIGLGLALAILDTWLRVPFEGGRHQRRLALLESE